MWQHVVTHANNGPAMRKRMFKQAKEVILSNAGGFRDEKVQKIAANTMVIIMSEEDSGIPFYIAMLLEACDLNMWQEGGGRYHH